MTGQCRARILLLMDEDTITDLKQFIAATVSQQLSEIRGDISDIRVDISDIRSDIRKLDEKLTGKIDDLSASVAKAIEAANESTASQLQDHEQRIGRLEQNAA